MQHYLRAGALHGFVELVEKNGGDPSLLLGQCGILSGHIHDPDNLILYEHLGELLELSASVLAMPTIGVQLGMTQGISTIGIIGAYMSQQETIGQSLAVAQKFTYMHAQGALLRVDVDSTGLCVLSLEMLVNQRGQYPQLVLLSISLIYKMIEDMLGMQWRPEAVTFRQRPPEQVVEAIKQYFRCKVVFGAEQDSIHFAESMLSRRAKQPDNLISDIINKQFQIKQQNEAIDQVALITHAVNMLLPTGDCSKENVAQSIGVHPKKMERDLQAQNSSYKQIVEDTRKNITLRTLQLNNMSLTALALNLGYSEYSAFSRSFKNWFGKSVQAYRAEMNKQ